MIQDWMASTISRPHVSGERLGRSSIAITLGRCSHVMPGMQADVAEQVDAAISAAISRTREVHSVAKW
jgi:hypothetical protein